MDLPVWVVAGVAGSSRAWGFQEEIQPHRTVGPCATVSQIRGARRGDRTDVAHGRAGVPGLHYDPLLAFFHLGKGIDELKWAYLVLGIVLAGSLYIERFFCKYACPMGAALGLLGRIGLTKIHRDPAHCKGCNLCHTKCHAHVDFLSDTIIQDSECNHCMDCVVDCPRPNVLSVRGAKWRFSHPVYASVLVAGLFAVIGTSNLAGKWQTKPSMLSFTGPAGKVDPENIRGWMTLQEISAGYSVPLERLYQESGLPFQVPATARLNTIAREYKVRFEPDALREVVRRLISGERPAAPKPAASR